MCAFKALKGKSEQSLQRLIIREVFFWKWMTIFSRPKTETERWVLPYLRSQGTAPEDTEDPSFLWATFPLLPAPPPSIPSLQWYSSTLYPSNTKHMGIYPVSRKEVSMDCPISLNNSCYLSTLCKALYSFYTLSPLILTIAQWDGYCNYSSFYR